MPSQHPSISVPAAVLLGVAAVSATVLGLIVAAQSVFPAMHVYEGTTALLASLLALTGTGVIICQAADRVMRRLDELERRVTDLAAADDEAVAAARRINLRLLTGTRN